MANDQTKQVGVRVDEGLWQSFRDDVKRRNGAVKGHLRSELEAAIREYMEASHGGDANDKLTRIETRLDEIEETIEQTAQKKNDSGFSATVENRMDKIRQTIHEETDGAPRVHEQVVEMAIKKHAGRSDPTLRQYKRLLQEDRDLFEDPRPDQSYYFRDAPRFCAAVNEFVQDREIPEQDYLELVEERYGRDWWGDQVDTFEERTRTDGGDEVAFQ
jgi:hypothetical protein